MTPELTEALAIARELARLATLPGNPPPFSIGTQIARLMELEARIIEQQSEELLHGRKA